MTFEKIIEYAMFAIITGYLAWQKLTTNKRRREEEVAAEKERQLGLKPNPTRCGEHTASINKLADEIADLRVQMEVLRGELKAHIASHLHIMSHNR